MRRAKPTLLPHIVSYTLMNQVSHHMLSETSDITQHRIPKPKFFPDRIIHKLSRCRRLNGPSIESVKFAVYLQLLHITDLINVTQPCIPSTYHQLRNLYIGIAAQQCKKLIVFMISCTSMCTPVSSYAYMGRPMPWPCISHRIPKQHYQHRSLARHHVLASCASSGSIAS